MRNPRRAYHQDGTEVPPATVGGERLQGYHRAEIWYCECWHHAEVSTAGMPADLPVPDICLRFRCSQCGSRKLTSRMSVCEFYDVMQERTGMSHGNATSGKTTTSCR